NQMKSKTLEASDAGLDVESRTAISKDLAALKKQISTVIDGSDFNGVNLLKGTGASDTTGGKVTALQSIATDATTGAAPTLQIDNQGFSTMLETLDDDAISDLAGDDSADAAEAANGLTVVLDKFFDDVKGSLSVLGAGSRQIEGQLAFNSNLTDVVTSGIGNLVDADLAKESASLQALQVQQQLGVQALSIANQAPQTLLSLFR
ncbi:MAG TPA: flagellin, partial [Novosphingobium sp.]|nr:flagellin [Novosphingobium sp.]